MSVSIVRRQIPQHEHALPGDLHPVLSRIYQARQVSRAEELDNSLSRCLSPALLSGVDTAVALLMKAIERQQRILVVGDFDADGATSAALAVRALKKMGAASVDYLVPNRFEFGYGLTPEIVAVAADYSPDLIITVDNGISSIDGVAAAKSRGIPVLVTDHHLPGSALPAADAIVNPNQNGDTFPSKAMAGVGVIFYVMLALRSALREADWFAQRGREEPNLAELLDLVALGTVADVVPLDHNNRVLVSQGLARIRNDRCCAGIRALCQVAGRQQYRLQATDLAFALGPRLNAAGRIEDMSLGIECLLTDDEDKALQLAQRLDQLNRERRNIEEDMKAQAQAILQQIHLDEKARLPVGLCLFDENWHQGVIGILASRLKDQLHRPVIVFADAGQSDDNGEPLIKGSARSVAGLHIRDALDAVAAHHPGLVSKFGGHAMAAGLTLQRRHFEDFARAFNEEVMHTLGHDDLFNTLYSDGELAADELCLELAELLRGAGPWGQGFPEPLFDGEFELVQRRIVGEHHLKLVLRIPGSETAIDAIAFRTTDAGWPAEVGRVQLAYKLDVNEYRGVRSVQLIVEHITPIPG
jgi:single-stranded-DNA-specific exonuclease